MSSSMKSYALDQKEQNWEEWFAKRGGQPFGAQQVMRWLYVHHEFDPLKYSNIALPFRQPLVFDFDWSLPEIDSILRSSDDSEKVLIATKDGRFIESVIMT